MRRVAPKSIKLYCGCYACRKKGKPLRSGGKKSKASKMIAAQIAAVGALVKEDFTVWRIRIALCSHKTARTRSLYAGIGSGD